MLTLKVITQDCLDNTTTYLFSGERLSHQEYEERDHDREYSNEVILVGELQRTSSNQPYVMSCVRLFKTEDECIDIFILPKSDCFVMENGKTVDTFKAYFK